MQVTRSPRTDRRDQIIGATIEVIARDGVGAATFARIREHAGISSTRLISYHFDSKDALLSAALERVLAEASAVMSAWIAAAKSPREKLAAYIRSNLAFLAAHPDYALAAAAIVSADQGRSIADGDHAERRLAKLFRDAQRDGLMRAFDPDTVAATVRAAIDRTVARFARSAELDLVSCGEELVDLFDRVVRTD